MFFLPLYVVFLIKCPTLYASVKDLRTGLGDSERIGFPLCYFRMSKL